MKNEKYMCEPDMRDRAVDVLCGVCAVIVGIMFVVALVAVFTLWG